MIRNLGQRCRWLFVTGRSTSVMLARWLGKMDWQVLHLKMSNDLVPKWNSSFVSWWTTFWTTPSGHGFSLCFCFIYNFSSFLLLDTVKSWVETSASIPKVIFWCQNETHPLCHYEHSPEAHRVVTFFSSTLMQFYDSRPPVLWSKWPLASSLLQAIKTCRQACPPSYLLHFS